MATQKPCNLDTRAILTLEQNHLTTLSKGVTFAVAMTLYKFLTLRVAQLNNLRFTHFTKQYSPFLSDYLEEKKPYYVIHFSGTCIKAFGNENIWLNVMPTKILLDSSRFAQQVDYKLEKVEVDGRFRIFLLLLELRW